MGTAGGRHAFRVWIAVSGTHERVAKWAWLRYTVALQEAFMKKLFVLWLVLGITFCTTARAANDPGATYADAFILAQDAQSAEANSDWAAAFSKYSAAAELLRGIRASNPEWNPQVVEYRLKDVTQRLESVKGKVSE